MKVTCCICGKSKSGVKPSNIKDPNTYHCKKGDCHRKYMQRKYGNPKTKPTWNWAYQKALNKKAKELEEERQKHINPSSA